METLTDIEHQQKDSDMIFNQIHQAFDNMDEAKSAIVAFYVTDMSISRAGISHAIGRLEQYYREKL